MKDLKIVEHIVYTYETADGRNFDDKSEAEEWQEKLSIFEDICMLDYEFEPTKNVESTFYVFAKTKEQVEAFNSVSERSGVRPRIDDVGYYHYDERSNDFVNIELKINILQNMIDKLKGSADVQQKMNTVFGF